MDTRHFTTVIDGMQVHWAECGPKTDKVPVVLLHGLHDSHLTWKRIAPLLAAGRRRVLMPDLLGCGLSERPDASYELHWHAQMIGKWLAALRIKDVDLIGHSFGGGVAQMLLLAPGVRVRRLGLIASGGLGQRVGFWLRMAALPRVVERFGQPFMGVGTRFALKRARAFMSDEDVAELSAMNSGDGSARAFARTVADVISWRGQKKHFFHRAHQIRQLPPMMLFWGHDDEITPFEDAKAFTKSIDGVNIVSFEGCGHYVQHEKTEELARHLRQFLSARNLPRARLPKRRIRAAAQPLWARRLGALLDRLIPDLSIRA